MKNSKGIITIAYGDPKFLKMAKALALSLKNVNDNTPRAIVTDFFRDEELNSLFDFIIDLNPEYGYDHAQHAYLDIYSPFDITLFIDADSLVFKPLNIVWEIFEGHNFCVHGNKISTGHWHFDVEKVKGIYGVDSIPAFNGGMYYFDKSEKAKIVFEHARELIPKYYKIGLEEFHKGGISDEALICLGMLKAKIDPIKDYGKTMRTPLGIKGRLHLDILSNKAWFQKYEDIVEPAVVHFCYVYQIFHIYKREIAKLKMFPKMKSLGLKSFIINSIYLPLITFDKIRVTYWKCCTFWGRYSSQKD